MTQTYKLSVTPNAVPVIVKISQYDTSLREIAFELLNEDVYYEIPSGSVVTVRGLKTDGRAFEYDATFSGHTVTFPIHEQMSVLSGKQICEVRITNGGILGTANFVLLVEESPIQNAITSETDIPMLEEAIQAAETIMSIAGTSMSEWLTANSATINEWIEAWLERQGADGYYPQMTVGMADNLRSDKYITDTTPYMTRSTPSVGNRKEMEIVGGSIVWNQLVQNPNFADSTDWTAMSGTLSVADGIATLSHGSGVKPHIYQRLTTPTNATHKYLLVCDIKATDTTVMQYIGVSSTASGGGGSKGFDVTGDWQTISYARSGASLSHMFIGMYANLSTSTSADGTIQIRNVGMYDLTQMFGSTVADYIYNLEQANAGDGVAFFKALFPADYYEYNAGELMSVNTSANVNKDADGNVVGSYALDSSLTLRGVPKVANGKLYYDGDTYQYDGTVTRRYGIVDLGSLTWTRNTYTSIDAGGYFRATISGRLPGRIFGHMVSSKYDISPYAGASSNATNYGTSVDKIVFADTSASSVYIYIIDSAYTNATSFKTAMSGVMLVYELAAPTTESANPYAEIMVCDAEGTEEFTCSNVVPVGQNTKYLYDLGKVLSNIADVPTTDGTYTLKVVITDGKPTFQWL